jgi:hypothetical protein
VGVTEADKEIKVALEDCEFYDVDEDTNEPVSVTNIITTILTSAQLPKKK